MGAARDGSILREMARLEGALAGADGVVRAALDGLRAALGASPPLECERKYLLARAPRVPAGLTCERLEIEQGWLPGTLLRERLRRTRDARGEHFERALKLGRGVARIELEEPLAPEFFRALWPWTAGCRVAKTRLRVAHGGRLWELDDFGARDLWLAEVEFEHPDEHPAPPAWLAECIVREVSDEPAFSNLALATAWGVADAQGGAG